MNNLFLLTTQMTFWKKMWLWAECIYLSWAWSRTLGSGGSGWHSAGCSSSSLSSTYPSVCIAQLNPKIQGKFIAVISLGQCALLEGGLGEAFLCMHGKYKINCIMFHKTLESWSLWATLWDKGIFSSFLSVSYWAF